MIFNVTFYLYLEIVEVQQSLNLHLSIGTLLMEVYVMLQIVLEHCFVEVVDPLVLYIQFIFSDRYSGLSISLQ